MAHDKNQNHLTECLRKLGWRVHFTTKVGNGFPDAVATRDGLLVLIEFKIDSKQSPITQLRVDQLQFHADWEPGVIYIIRNEVDCVELLTKETARLKQLGIMQ